MNKDSIILLCTECGTKNRVPILRINDAPKCGKCSTSLSVESLTQPINVTDNTFDKVVFSSALPVLVDCWAPWCGPCRAIAPVLDELSIKYSGKLKIAKLNLDENPAIGSRYSITSVPTMLLIKNGQIVDKLIGALPKEQLESQIARVISS